MFSISAYIQLMKEFMKKEDRLQILMDIHKKHIIKKELKLDKLDKKENLNRYWIEDHELAKLFKTSTGDCNSILERLSGYYVHF